MTRSLSELMELQSKNAGAINTLITRREHLRALRNINNNWRNQLENKYYELKFIRDQMAYLGDMLIAVPGLSDDEPVVSSQQLLDLVLNGLQIRIETALAEGDSLKQEFHATLSALEKCRRIEARYKRAADETARASSTKD